MVRSAVSRQDVYIYIRLYNMKTERSVSTNMFYTEYKFMILSISRKSKKCYLLNRKMVENAKWGSKSNFPLSLTGNLRQFDNIFAKAHELRFTEIKRTTDLVLIVMYD